MKIVSQCCEPDGCTMVLFSKPKRKFRLKQTKMLRSLFALLTLSLVCCGTSVFAQTPPAQPSPRPQLSTGNAEAQQSPAAGNSFDLVVDRAVEREHFFMGQMKQLHPLVET